MSSPQTLPAVVKPQPEEPKPAEPTQLPVTLTFTHRFGHKPDDGKLYTVVRGHLVNNSSRALSINVVVTDSSGAASTSRITLDPFGQRDFGPEDGLEMRARDTIRMQSAPYPDVEMSVQ